MKYLLIVLIGLAGCSKSFESKCAAGCGLQEAEISMHHGHKVCMCKNADDTYFELGNPMRRYNLHPAISRMMKEGKLRR